MTDLTHLEVINLRLSNERDRARKEKKAKAREWREHNCRMIEKERETEIAFLTKQGVSIPAHLLPDDEPPANMEELLAELDQIEKDLGI